MAGKGRQIYLTQDEIEEVYTTLEWRIIGLSDEIQRGIERLHFSIASSRRAGDPPKREDFNPLLPNPEADYQAALWNWNGYKNGWREDLQEIRDLQTDRNRFKRLQRKLWYR